MEPVFDKRPELLPVMVHSPPLTLLLSLQGSFPSTERRPLAMATHHAERSLDIHEHVRTN